MKNWGIRTRVLFLALAPSVLILHTLVSYFTYTRIVEVDAALARQGLSVARQLAPGAEFALFAGDHAALQRLADAAAREANVSGIRITDASGRELARTVSEDAGAAASETIDFEQPVFETRVAVDIPGEPRVPAAVAPIGQIRVTMSRHGARAEHRRLVATGLVLGLACMLGAVALAIVTGDTVIKPVRALAGAMRDLGRGRRDAPLEVSAGGELRTLQEGFNDMSARLHASTEELQARIDAATRALVSEKQTAEEATAAKSRFIAAASHDLRQPLHAIGMFTAALERRCRGSDVEAVVADLAQAVAVMDQLFDSLLDISKFDAGTLHAQTKPIRLERLFAQLAAEHREAAVQKQLTLRFHPTRLAVRSDELLLHRLLGNLVSNAIRYTERGAVLIGARHRGGEIQIEVRDSGIGIAPEHVEEIFREFYQVANPARDRTLGLGLGLAIVSRIARLLGTQVHVRSAPGHGSVFWLRVQRTDASDADATPEDEHRIGEAPATLPVLVVDDDRLVLAGTRALLEKLGCRVVTAHDAAGAEAALRAIDERFVLVLCDLWLSDRDSGIALLRGLAAMTPVSVYGVVVSGDTSPETIQLARDAGFELLHKPVSPARLRAVVTHFASKRRVPMPS